MSARKKMLVADLLCGAGGSSTGILRALTAMGMKMDLVCVNHWGVALETHKKNHPHARHYCEDIAAVRPHIIVPEGYLDLLTASPTCTFHSVARGGKPMSDQQRSDPWHIITWLTELDVRRMIVENVWEFINWGPVDPKTMRPIKERKKEYFNLWIDTIRRLGYDPEWKNINAANYGEATTRSRFILKARKDGRAIGWAPHTHTRVEEGKLELFPTVKPWRAAREIIDWSIRGKSIFGRPVPLAPKTLERLLAGMLKFNWPWPFVFRLVAELERSLVYSYRRNFRLRHSKSAKLRLRAHKKIKYAIPRLRRLRVEPIIVSAAGEYEPMMITLRQNADGRSTSMPVPTLAANGQHIALAEPVFMNGRKGNQAEGVSRAPVPTLDTKGGVWLAEPIVLSQQNSGAPRSTNDPLPTITTGGAAPGNRQGCARPMLAEPFVATVAHGNDTKEKNPNNRRVKSTGEPIGAIHGEGVAFAVVRPFILSPQGEGAPRSTSQPTPSQTSKHGHVLIAPYYGSGSGETCSSADTPLPTITSKERFGIVVPLTHAGGLDRALDAGAAPMPTITTANRGELALVSGDISQYDVLFRMFEAHELAGAMGFTTEEYKYEFAGTKTEQIKQIGNAVSVRMMEAEVRALMYDAAPKAWRDKEAARRLAA